MAILFRFHMCTFDSYNFKCYFKIYEVFIIAYRKYMYMTDLTVSINRAVLKYEHNKSLENLTNNKRVD